MGVQGEDLLLSPFARDILRIQVECKRRERFSWQKDFDQATGHGSYEPVLVCRGDRKKAVAIVDLDHYLALLKAHITLENEL
jgi:hypothetical protein